MSRPETGGGGSTTRRPRRRHQGPVIQTHPGTHHQGGAGTGGNAGGQTGTGNHTGSGSGSGSGGSGGGGGGGGGISGAERRANAKENKAKRDAANRFIADARALQYQLNAMAVALGPHGFRHALNVQLAGVKLSQTQVENRLMKDYGERTGVLTKTAADNEKAAGSSTFMALSNRGRERANALSEAAAQGAGESDNLRAQSAALRNWNSNQNEANRTFYDTLTSINSSLTDLTVDTRTARANNVIEANSDRNQLWTDYYGHRSETLTNMSNVRGQMAEYYGLANEQVGGKGYKKKQTANARAAAALSRRSALNTGRAWHNPGVGKAIQNWQGAAAIEGQVSNSNIGSGISEKEIKAPEGASLRRWDQDQ